MLPSSSFLFPFPATYVLPACLIHFESFGFLVPLPRLPLGVIPFGFFTCRLVVDNPLGPVGCPDGWLGADDTPVSGIGIVSPPPGLMLLVPFGLFGNIIILFPPPSGEPGGFDVPEVGD